MHGLHMVMIACLQQYTWVCTQLAMLLYRVTICLLVHYLRDFKLENILFDSEKNLKLIGKCIMITQQ